MSWTNTALNAFGRFCFFRCDSYQPIIVKLKSCFPPRQRESAAVLYMEVVSDPLACCCLHLTRRNLCSSVFTIVADQKKINRCLNKSVQVGKQNSVLQVCSCDVSEWNMGWGGVTCRLLNFSASSEIIRIIDGPGLKVHQAAESLHVCESRFRQVPLALQRCSWTRWPGSFPRQISSFISALLWCFVLLEESCCSLSCRLDESFSLGTLWITLPC